MLNTRRKNFAEVLCSLYGEFESDDFDIQNYNSRIKKAFINLSKGANDELERAEKLEFGGEIGNFPDNKNYGFKVKDKHIFISLILNLLEQVEIPEVVSERFPDLTHDEWIACIRMATLVFMAFSPTKPIRDT